MHNGVRSSGHMSWLVAIPIFIELILCIVAIWERRVPRGHDGIILFGWQYFFANEARQTGEIAQWMPYMTQGTVTTWWYALSSSLWQSTMMLFWPVTRLFKDFLPLYHIGILVDHLLLLAGTLLLARRYVQSNLALCFIGTSLLGTSVWMDQPWYSLKLFATLPVAVHFTLLFVEMASYRYLVIAIGIIAAQHLGNLPYFLPLFTWLIFIHCGLYFLFSTKCVWPAAQKLVSKPFRGILALSFCVAFLAGLFFLSTSGTGEIVNYSPGRNADGTTDLHVFLTHGGRFEAQQLIDLLFGFAPNIDCTIYVGVVTLTLFVAAFFVSPMKKVLPLALTLLSLVLFTMGTTWSEVAYQTWPQMKFYRHIGPAICAARLYLCLIAGVGLDNLITRGATLHRNLQFIALRRIIISFFVLLGVVSLYCLFDSQSVETIRKLSSSSNMPSIDGTHGGDFRFPVVLSQTLSRLTFLRSFIVCVFGAVLWKSRILALHTHRNMILFFVVLCLLDTYFYKIVHASLRLIRLPSAASTITQFQEFPFYLNRSSSLEGMTKRGDLIIRSFPRLALRHWTLQSLFWEDLYDSENMRTEHWLRSIDNVIRIATHTQFGDSSKPGPSLLHDHGLVFPKHPTLLKFAGVTHGKLQFFSQGKVVPSLESARVAIDSGATTGETAIFVQEDVGENLVDAGLISRSLSWGTARRVNLLYNVQDFSTNHLILKVSNQYPKPVWLVYSDAYHPRWKAQIDGQAIPIYRANIGYKAVIVPPGDHTVIFEFHNRTIAWLGKFGQILSFILFVFLLLKIAEILRIRAPKSRLTAQVRARSTLPLGTSETLRG